MKFPRLDSAKSIILIYAIAALLVTFFVFTLLYQYIAALGSWPAVLSAMESDRLLSALWLSIASSVATTILAIILGVPLAYVFATVQFKGKLLVETLAVDVPQTFPPVAEGIILFLMLGPGSPLHINLAFTFAAIVIAKFYIAAPFVVSFVARRFRDIRKSGIHLTARSLGANPFQVFTTVYLPLSLKDIAAGSALCWSRAMGELGGTLVFAGVVPFQTETLPTFIALNSTTLTAAALGATILATTASTIALLSFKKLTGQVEK